MNIKIFTPVKKGGPYYWGENLARLLCQRGYNVEHVKTINNILFNLFFYKSSIIHSSIPIGIRSYKKFILTVKGDYTIEKRRWQLLYKKSINVADIITTPSHYLKEKLFLDDALVIPNAIFPNSNEKIYEPKDGPINLVTTTKFFFKGKAEGILELIKVVNYVQTQIEKEIKLFVVGDGPLITDIQKRSSKYNVNVIFLGYLKDPQSFIRNCDIFLYYSYHDNFPNAILEAMNCGLPIISNEIGAVKEIITNSHDGFLADTSKKYCEILLKLIENEDLRERLGKSARLSIFEKFDWNVIMNKYLELYEL